MEGKPDEVIMEETVEDVEAKHEQSNTPTAAEEAAVIRKMDFRIMPLLLLFYTLSVLDRSNLGNAKLAGLPQSIDLSGGHYAFLATIFYIAYILFQWTAAGFKHFPAHRWVACVIFAIGTLSTCQAAVKNYPSMVGLRFLLGAAEAMYAGTPYYLSFFYPRHKVGLRQGIFLSGSALANAYGGALGYAIGQITGGVPPWKILFIIEGLPSVCAAGLAWWLLPDNIGTAKFLTMREKEVAFYFLQKGQVADVENHTGIRWKQYLQAFTDYKCFIPGLIYFSCNVSFASLPLFVPTIIKEMGSFNSQQSNGLSAPPYLLCIFTMLTASFLSDRFKIRGPFVAGSGLIAAIGFILLATTKTAAARYIGVFFAINIFVSVATLLPWIANSHETESTRAGGWGIAATLGQCGPLLGTNIFPAKDGPYYHMGSWISCAFCLFVAFLSLAYMLLLSRENRKLDLIWAAENADGQSREKGFRYSL